MAVKKTTTKLKKKTSTKKKEPIKKIVKKKVVSKKNKTVSKQTDKKSLLWFFTTLLFAGAFLGSLYINYTKSPEKNIDTTQKIIRIGGQTFVSVKNLNEEFLVELNKTKNDKKSEFAVYGGKTWIPIEGSPVEVIALTNSSCKACDINGPINALRQNITPALLVRTVESDSEEGKKLIDEFNLKSIPQFILADGITNLNTRDGKKFVEASKNILIKKDNRYLLDGAKVGFKVGEFIETPSFANLDSEPVQGKGGKVQVVEFTDYQCPYCKRLHDNNKELIAKLIKEGKIEYIVKDFPLGFHKESVSAHKAANCVLREGTNDNYWKMNGLIFDNNKAWSNTGIENATKYFIGLADKDLDLDIMDCMADKTLDKEIADDMIEGQKYGVSGTPALFIGKTVMPGAIDAATFEKAVESSLK